MDTDRIIERMPDFGLSEHIKAELDYARANPEYPLSPAEKIPTCPCSKCNNEPKPRAAPVVREDDSMDLVVAAARQTPILDIAVDLGMGEGKRQGQGVWFRCPMHDDSRPSLKVEPQKGVWYCYPCGEGGDGITLWMVVREVDFATAVKQITGRET